jgi:hypothetical protein
LKYVADKFVKRVCIPNVGGTPGGQNFSIGDNWAGEGTPVVVSPKKNLDFKLDTQVTDKVYRGGVPNGHRGDITEVNGAV